MKKLKLQERIINQIDFIKVLEKRRTVREFDPDKEITLKEISTLLWATYGITDKNYGLKTSPSAGARYPLEIFFCNKEGFFRYIPEENSILKVKDIDIREKLSHYAYEQDFIKDAPTVFVIAADFKRTTSRYGKRGERYVYIDLGHAAQNLLLCATYLGLGACPVGAFDDEKIKKLLEIDFDPLYIIPVGYPKNF
ncbi:MAG: SagB/ThcOx family dehydrogenase [candidate division WOR-3 bacterium]